MPPFALSDERLAALANLVQDEAAFEQAYPRVDYLSMAEQLAGTGNAVADAAFDLRLLHFMKGELGIGRSGPRLRRLVEPGR
ncbi:hypothetical protein ACWEO2_26105 [Nocardia sp. NPDC004278]